MRNAKAAIGFRAKTGRAIAVALTASVEQPSLLWRREVSLADPEVPETAQPYHVVMELDWPESIIAVKPYASAIEAVAYAMMGALLRELDEQHFTVGAIGIAGSPDRDLARIGNPHIRAHGAEGILFRRVLEMAAEAQGLRWRSFSEKSLASNARSELGLSPARLASSLKKLGAQAGPPWRAEEKAAATAAWLAGRQTL